MLEALFKFNTNKNLTNMIPQKTIQMYFLKWRLILVYSFTIIKNIIE